MRALYIHISGLAGLLVFLKEVLNYAPIERTVLVAATTGLTVYLMLIVGHSIVQRIMAYSPPTPSQGAKHVPQHNNPMEGAPPAPAEAPAGTEAAALAAETSAAPDAPNQVPASGDATDQEPDADGNAASAEVDASAPDRAPASDRPDAELSESVTKTPA